MEPPSITMEPPSIITSSSILAHESHAPRRHPPAASGCAFRCRSPCRRAASSATAARVVGRLMRCPLLDQQPILLQ
eukprot:scaffold16567_cov42-Phaeocystis_antarctica.AAC.2